MEYIGETLKLLFFIFYISCLTFICNFEVITNLTSFFQLLIPAPDLYYCTALSFICFSGLQFFMYPCLHYLANFAQHLTLFSALRQLQSPNSNLYLVTNHPLGILFFPCYSVPFTPSSLPQLFFCYPLLYFFNIGVVILILSHLLPVLLTTSCPKVFLNQFLSCENLSSEPDVLFLTFNI